MVYGASHLEWSHFDVFLNLTPDLLPVVCEPNLPISPNSTLKSYGKVPSIVSGQGFVVGLSKWTSRVTTDRDIAAWSADPRYGICLQTRRVRAIDVDIDDEFAALVRRTILDWDPSIEWPIRTRENSHKFLMLFELEGDYGKQRLATPHGLIEWLAGGQQCLVAGCHPSGVRYRWHVDAGARGRSGTWPVLHGHRDLATDRIYGPSRVPVLTAEQWADLQDLLELTVAASGETWTESRTATPREKIGGNLTVNQLNSDPIVQFLREKGWVKR